MKKSVAMLVLTLAPVGAYAADIKGTWLTEEGKGRVVMEPCGSKVCGKIVWLKEANDKNGKPQVDALNRNASLRTHPVVGIKVTEMTAKAANAWTGTIYNPEDGKTYDATADMQADGSLLVKGCILGGVVCDDQTWTRLN